MELSFGNGRYFGLLSLSCGHRGILEVYINKYIFLSFSILPIQSSISRADSCIFLQAAIYTPYTLKNNTDFGLFCLAPNQNPLSRYLFISIHLSVSPHLFHLTQFFLFRNEVEELSSQGYSKLGAFLPPKSTKSWFLR